MVKALLLTIPIVIVLISKIVDFMYTPGYLVGMTNNKKMPHDPIPTYNYTDCSLHKCDWQIYSESASPQEYLTEESISHLYDDLAKRPSCQPSTFGYTEREYSRIFMNTTYPACSEKIQTFEPIIKIDPASRILTMTCPGYYYLGQPASGELLGLEPYKGKAIKYSGPVNLEEGQEWAFGTCRENKEIQSAAYELLESEEVKLKTKETMEKVQAEVNMEKGNKKTQPITVLNIFLDSISRKSFYRKLPITQQYLNSIDSDKFKVYDFKLHTVVADNSLPNLYPLWTGLKLPTMTTPEQRKNKGIKEDLVGDLSIWSYLREKGWVTMFGTEFCNDYFAFGMGRKPKVDHLAAKFWCGANKLTGFSDTEHNQRCIGDKNSHYFILNYTLQYINAYQGLNKWAHIMSVPAHDDTGTVISTVDSDLAEFLAKALNTSDNIVIMLAADHGMRYGEWYRLENGGQEHRLPMLFMIASKGLLNQLKYSDDILTHNSKRLITKYDIHDTLKHLAMIPYNTEYFADKPFPLYNESTSLLLHKVPDERICEVVGIDAEYCPCPRYFEYKDPDIEIVNDALEIILKEINYGAAITGVDGGRLCKILSLKKIIMAKWAIQDYKIMIKMRFLVNEAKGIEFESTVLIFGTYMKYKPIEEGYRYSPYYLDGKRTVRVMDVKNNYNDENCYQKAVDKGISPNLCICNN